MCLRKLMVGNEERACLNTAGFTEYSFAGSSCLCLSVSQSVSVCPSLSLKWKTRRSNKLVAMTA